MLSVVNGSHQKKLLYSLQEIAELTGLSLPYLRMRAGNELKVTRFGKAVRVRAEDLEWFLANGAQSYKAHNATA